MKNPDVVLRELGQLHDFRRELAKFRFSKTIKASRAAPARKSDPLAPRPGADSDLFPEKAMWK